MSIIGPMWIYLKKPFLDVVIDIGGQLFKVYCNFVFPLCFYFIRLKKHCDSGNSLSVCFKLFPRLVIVAF